MTDGNIYTLAGVVNGPSDVTAFNDMYAALEVGADTAAPLLSEGFPLLRPRHLVVQRKGATADSHLFITSKFAHRIFFIPGGFQGSDPTNPLAGTPADTTTMFGRTFYAGRLYTLCGNGTLPAGAQADGLAGRDFELNEPTGLTQDSEGNLYVLDSLEGAVRLVRATTGQVITLPLKAVGGTADYMAPNGQDLRVVETTGGNFLYVANMNAHTVDRFALPSDLTTLAAGTPANMTAETILGVKDEPGYIAAGKTYPDVQDVSKPLLKADARLNEPTSITFDADGNLIVADKGRIHLLEQANLAPAVTAGPYVIAGGLDTRFLIGDSRLGYFPGTTSVRFDAVSGNTLVVDSKENRVRRLWTARGAL
jgi:hypothetical protein